MFKMKWTLRRWVKQVNDRLGTGTRRDARFQSPRLPEFHVPKVLGTYYLVQPAGGLWKILQVRKDWTLLLEKTVSKLQRSDSAGMCRKRAGRRFQGGPVEGQARVASVHFHARFYHQELPALMRGRRTSWWTINNSETLLKIPLQIKSWNLKSGGQDGPLCPRQYLIFIVRIQTRVSTICDMCPWYKNRNFRFPSGLDALHKGEKKSQGDLIRKKNLTSWGWREWRHWSGK